MDVASVHQYARDHGGWSKLSNVPKISYDKNEYIQRSQDHTHVMKHGLDKGAFIDVLASVKVAHMLKVEPDVTHNAEMLAAQQVNMLRMVEDMVSAAVRLMLRRRVEGPKKKSKYIKLIDASSRVFAYHGLLQFREKIGLQQQWGTLLAFEAGLAKRCRSHASKLWPGVCRTRKECFDEIYKLFILPVLTQRVSLLRDPKEERVQGRDEVVEMQKEWEFEEKAYRLEMMM